MKILPQLSVSYIHHYDAVRRPCKQKTLPARAKHLFDIEGAVVVA